MKSFERLDRSFLKFIGRFDVRKKLVRCEHASRYEFASKFVEEKKVLDIACGSGYGAEILLKGNPKKIVGADLNEDSLKNCKNKYANSKVEFIKKNAENFDFEEKFDVIISFETIEHLNFPEKLLECVRKAMIPGGIFIISTPNRNFFAPGSNLKDKPRNKFHIFEYNKTEFEKVLTSHFDGVEFYAQEQSMKKGFDKYSKKIFKIKNTIASVFSKNVAMVEKIKLRKEPAYIIAVCR
jgi:SAM-dependent methyltransferase